MKTTSTEFEEWKCYLDMEPNFFHREDFYWANMIVAIRQLFSSKPELYTVENSLLKFEKKNVPIPVEVDKEQVKKERSNIAKSIWCSWLGLGKGK